MAIRPFPGAALDHSEVKASPGLKTIPIDSEFANLKPGPDEKRRLADKRSGAEETRCRTLAGRVLSKKDLHEEYDDYLSRARNQDFSDLEALELVYRSGTDEQGRPVIVFVAAHLPAKATVNRERILMFLIKTMDPLVAQDYNLVYLHANLEAKNRLPLASIRQVYRIFKRKYKKNLKRLFIVHPTWWVRTVFYVARAFVRRKFFRKLHCLNRLADLFMYFDPKQLQMPKHILEWDQSVNGESYAMFQYYAAHRDSEVKGGEQPDHIRCDLGEAEECKDAYGSRIDPLRCVYTIHRV